MGTRASLYEWRRMPSQVRMKQTYSTITKYNPTLTQNRQPLTVHICYCSISHEGVLNQREFNIVVRRL